MLFSFGRPVYNMYNYYSTIMCALDYGDIVYMHTSPSTLKPVNVCVNFLCVWYLNCLYLYTGLFWKGDHDLNKTTCLNEGLNKNNNQDINTRIWVCMRTLINVRQETQIPTSR